jgi:hypothetical protein
VYYSWVTPEYYPWLPGCPDYSVSEEAETIVLFAFAGKLLVNQHLFRCKTT